MSNGPKHSAELEPGLQRILHDWLLACDVGSAPSPDEVIALHPKWADDLREFFRDEQRMNQLARSVRGLADTMAPEERKGAADHGSSMRRVPYLGDYELIEEIASGGMGVVYKARQVSVGRIVALKMILGGDLATASQVQRFRLEAEAAANLDHPHIVPIYEVGDHEGRHYFSMKLIEGRSLAEAMPTLRPGIKAVAPRPRVHWPRRRGGKAVDHLQHAVQLMATVARAVHFAHQRGIVHRDLKPGNILLDSSGQPHVTDFGLARRLEGDSNLTHTGAIVGTPAYMAPEQAAGRRDACTTAADIYSLGAILYEMLTGRPPFRGETPLDTLRQVVERAPQPPSTVDASVDRDLQAICLRCLDKDPQRRYSSAAALAEDLERWLMGEPTHARPFSMPQLLWRWLRNNVRAAVWTVLIGVAAGAAWNLVTLKFTWDNTIHAAGSVYAHGFPSLPAPWLASTRELPLWLLLALAVICVPFLGVGIGLSNCLLLKPRGALADVAAGLSTGLVAGISMFVLGHGAETVWSHNDLRGKVESGLRTFADAITQSQPIVTDEAGNPISPPAVGAVSPRQVIEQRYPDLRADAGVWFPEIPLRQKISVDLRVGLVTGIFWGTLSCLGMGIFASTVQTVAAGHVARRAHGGWGMLVPYAELAIATQWAVMALFGGLPPGNWPFQAALAFVAVGGVLAGVDWRLRWMVYLALIGTATLNLTRLFSVSPADFSMGEWLHLLAVGAVYLALPVVYLWIDRSRRQADVG
jgi:hypothetical protein